MVLGFQVPLTDRLSAQCHSARPAQIMKNIIKLFFYILPFFAKNIWNLKVGQAWPAGPTLGNPDLDRCYILIPNFSCVFCLLDCSEFYCHGRLQESPVLVRPRGGPRRVLEKSSSERSWFVIDLLSLLWVSSRNMLYSQYWELWSSHRHCLYFFMCVGRPFLWRHTSRSDHLNWQSAVDWIQKQQQLGGQRLFSNLRRYNIDDTQVLICSLHATFAIFV